MIRMISAALAASVLVAAPALAQDADRGGMSREQRVEKRNERMTRMFERLDRNGDATLDRSEAEAPLARAFDRIDKNKDGVLDESEIKTVRDKRASRGARAERRGGDRFERADADRDGKVTREEFLASPFPWFVRADANKDEKVTRAELDDLLAKRSKRAERAGAKDGAKDGPN